MTDATRRSVLSATGALAAVSLAGCATSASSNRDGTTESTDAETETSPTTETPTTGASTARKENGERTTKDTTHPGILSITNDTDESREFTVTVVNDRTDEERTFDRIVAAGKKEKIAGAYPIVDDGIVTHATTLESDGTVVGEYDVRVFDYHKVHDVTATVTESGVEWTTAVH